MSFMDSSESANIESVDVRKLRSSTGYDTINVADAQSQIDG